MRRTLLALLISFGLVAAQFSELDLKLAECENECCTGARGIWNDSAQACAIGPADAGYNDFVSCHNDCLAAASGSYGGAGGYGGLCCAPAFLVLGVLGLGLGVLDSGNRKPAAGNGK